jgi:hypothetical protein
MTNTIQFAKFPFDHKGFSFVSKVAETCEYLPQIVMMGEDFITMNREAIDTHMPDLEDMSYASIEKQIVFLNEGGSQMFLEFAGIA